MADTTKEITLPAIPVSVNRCQRNGNVRLNLHQGPQKELEDVINNLLTEKDFDPISTDSLLVYANEDPMVPPRFGEVFAAAISNARLVKLDRASHFAHVDATERFLVPVMAFLGAGPGGAREF